MPQNMQYKYQFTLSLLMIRTMLLENQINWGHANLFKTHSLHFGLIGTLEDERTVHPLAWTLGRLKGQFAHITKAIFDLLSVMVSSHEDM